MKWIGGMRWDAPFLVGALFLVLSPCAYAEKLPQDPKKAEVIVQGRVETIEEWWSLDTDYYCVWLRVEAVERGEAVQPGDLIGIRCFKWSRAWPGMVGAVGHRSIPDVGDQIRAFANPGPEGYVANYPRWYELIEASQHNWFVRTWGSYRKFRLVFPVAAAVLGGFLMYGVWVYRRRKRREAPAQTLG